MVKPYEGKEVYRPIYNEIKPVLEEVERSWPKKSLMEIAKDSPFSYGKLYWWCKRYCEVDIDVHKKGISETGRKYFNSQRTFKDGDYPEMLRLYQSGMGVYQIAEVYQCSQVTVWEFLKANNHQFRSKQENAKIVWSDPKRREAARKRSTESYLTRRKRGTIPEQQFSQWLDSIGVEYVDQYRGVGNGHPYDFYIPEWDMIVEIDGFFWHNKPEQKAKDIIHTKDALDRGYHVVRICTKELKENGNDYWKWFDERRSTEGDSALR